MMLNSHQREEGAKLPSKMDSRPTGLYYVGLGFEAKIHRGWTAGLGASFIGVAQGLTGQGSIEAGLHLSYEWNSPRR